MDSARENELSEGMQKRKKESTIDKVVTLAISIAMLAVGLSYNSDEECKGSATTFLIICGGIEIATKVLWLIAKWTPSKCDDKIMKSLDPIIYLVDFCVVMWGIVTIFGQYSQWVYEDNQKSSDYYCAYTPFVFAFVVLIFACICLPFAICVACLALKLIYESTLPPRGESAQLDV